MGWITMRKVLYAPTREHRHVEEFLGEHPVSLAVELTPRVWRTIFAPHTWDFLNDPDC